MELIVILVVSGIVASYAYGCGMEFGGRLGQYLGRRLPPPFKRR